MSNEISKKILEEMLDLSVSIIRHTDGSDVNRSIKDQLIRSVTSIGANYAEAQDASSKKDFINKIYIAKKEASETIYWLKLIAKLGDNSNEIVQYEDRSRKFVLLLQKIINSSKENRNTKQDNSS